MEQNLIDSGVAAKHKEPDKPEEKEPLFDFPLVIVDRVVNSEDLYEELDLVAVTSARNDVLCNRMIPYNVATDEPDLNCPTEDADEEREYSSISSNSEESGVTSPVFKYEEELDSLSLCSSTSVVDDKDLATTFSHDIISTPSQSTYRQTSEEPFLAPGDLPSGTPARRPACVQEEKFRRQNLRSSILKRLTISWKREYDFQLEIGKNFAEEDPQCSPDCQLTGPVAAPPQLPPARSDLKHDEVIRRHILGSIIDSENSYVDSLFKLVKEYQEPLEKATPPIISSTKIGIVFHKVSQILQIHLMLRTALTKLISDWKTERLGELGDIFVALFSKPYVSDMYAAYVCNFADAIDTIKKQAKEKPTFSEFLRTKQESSKDRLPLFGLLVKPVQRFPQFILLLQDLLKNSPPESADRISLQLALTHLETLADGLNERKREHEQEKAAKEVLRWAKVPAGYRNSTGDGGDALTRRVIADDEFKELELTPTGALARIKIRRLFLVNDLLICASPHTDRNDRLSPHWIVNIADVQIFDDKPVKFLGYQTSTAGSPAADTPKTDNPTQNQHQKLYQEMADLRMDYESVKRIHDISAGLKLEYSDLGCGRIRNLLNDIQSTIQVKMEEASRTDDCVFQLWISHGRLKNQKISFQVEKPKDKLRWMTLLHLSKLAYDRKRNPSWDSAELKGIGSPLFFLSRVLHLRASNKSLSYKCGCYCFLSPKDDPHEKPRLKKADGVVFLCSSDGESSKVSILSVERIRSSAISHQQQTLSIELLSFNLTQADISCCEWIPGVYEVDASAKGSLANDSVWIGTDSGSILVFLASSKVVTLGSTKFDSSVRSIRFTFDKVYVASADCTVKVFKRAEGGAWELKPRTTIHVAATGNLTCTVELPNKLLCAVDNQVFVINCITDTVVGHHQLRKSSECQIDKLACCGIGLWSSYQKSSVISLFHIETFKHLQDINIAPNINRILAERDSDRSARDIFVTSLLAIRGSLWVGTNVGLIVNLTLPKLDGIPIVLARPAVSFHAHVGPASLLMALQPRSVIRKPPARRPTWGDADFLDGSYKSFRVVSGGNQLVIRNWSDDSPDVFGLYDSLMRGSSSSEEEISSNGQVRYDLRRRRSLPLLPIDAEFHPGRPLSFMRSSELSGLVLRQSSSNGGSSARPMSFHPGPEWQPLPSGAIKNHLRGGDYLDNISESGSKTSDLPKKPQFVKVARSKSKHPFGDRNSTLIVISAGSGYRVWRGNGERDKDDSSLCLLGWEMKT